VTGRRPAGFGPGIGTPLVGTDVASHESLFEMHRLAWLSFFGGEFRNCAEPAQKRTAGAGSRRPGRSQAEAW